VGHVLDGESNHHQYHSYQTKLSQHTLSIAAYPQSYQTAYRQNNPYEIQYSPNLPQNVAVAPDTEYDREGVVVIP
jgi:hypothetical protein